MHYTYLLTYNTCTHIIYVHISTLSSYSVYCTYLYNGVADYCKITKLLFLCFHYNIWLQGEKFSPWKFIPNHVKAVCVCVCV